MLKRLVEYIGDASEAPGRESSAWLEMSRLVIWTKATFVHDLLGSGSRRI